MKLTILPLTAALLLAAICLPMAASAQVETREGIALQDQIAELRQELQAVQQNQQAGGSAQAQPQYQAQPPAPGQYGDTAAELVVRVSALEEQNRQLQGRVDDLTNQLQRQHDDLSKQVSDLAFKLGQGGSQPASTGDAGLGAAADGAAPQSAPAPSRPAPPPVRRTPELALRDGNAALARRDYNAAEAAAREVLATRSARGTDAQLLLARAEGGQHEFKAAAADYYQAYNRAPKSPSAPVALLGVSYSLIGLNDNRDACEALSKLSVEFPGAARASVAAARKRAGCGK